MTPPHPQPVPMAPTTGDRFRAGGWYFVLTIVSGGFLAAIPFWHAAVKLGRREVRTLALAYTAAGIYLFVLAGVTPTAPDGTSQNETLSTIGGLSALFVLVLACIQLRSLRREVYGGRGVVTAHDDPAVARALAAQARREETRRLLEREPTLRLELGIGRPDLRRGYDDGGLIDLSTAPAQVIADVCRLEPAHAEAIVAARTARGGTWFNIEDLFVDVPLPLYAQEQLRERAIL